MAGNFHSEALQLVERYTLMIPTRSTTRSRSGSQSLTRPWTIGHAASPVTDETRLFEYQCQSEAEEANGAFERDPKTWYPGRRLPPQPLRGWKDVATAWKAPAPTGAIKRLPDGKPDLQGFFLSDGGGANYGLGKHDRDFLTPEGRGVIVDPPDGLLPLQEWAKAETASRNTPERGYDDPTAHCFVAGVPRSMYVPATCRSCSHPDTSSSCTSACRGSFRPSTYKAAKGTKSSGGFGERPRCHRGSYGHVPHPPWASKAQPDRERPLRPPVCPDISDKPPRTRGQVASNQDPDPPAPGALPAQCPVRTMPLKDSPALAR